MGRKKVLVFVSLALLLLAMPLAGACAKEVTPTPAPAPVTLKFVTLRFSLYSSPTHIYTKEMTLYCERVKEATDGMVDIKLFPASGLVPSTEDFAATSSGVVDMSWETSAWIAKQVPIMTFIDIPFWGTPGHTWDVVKEIYPMLDAAWQKQNQKFVAPGLTWCYYVFMHNKKHIKTMEDMKGLIARGPGGMFDRGLQIWGASTVQMPTTEMYMALQRGTVDFSSSSYGTYEGFRLWEVAPYVSPLPQMTFGAGILAMNLDVWKKLTPQIQKIMSDVSNEAGRHVEDTMTTDFRESMKRIEAQGAKLYWIPDEEAKRWAKAVEPLYDEYAKMMGPEGAKIVEIVRKYK